MTLLHTPGPAMNDKLSAVVGRVWAHSIDGSTPLAVSLDREPAGHVAIETYAIVPTLERARFLVPIGSRPAAMGTLWAYHTMRAPQRRAAEATVAALFGAGVGGRVFPRRLVVSIDRRVPVTEHANWFILRHLADELGTGKLFAGLAVRRVQPNAKPLLELFDAAGQPQGYAKLGWSDATRQLVKAEADALVGLSGRLDQVIVPRLIAHSTWRDTQYSVTSPLPRGLRRYSKDPAAEPSATLDVAASSQITSSTLAESDYARDLRGELTTSVAGASEASHVLSDWLTRLERDPTVLRFGRWHGDWTPHNLGHAGARVAAWDWEHSRVGVPIGFDTLHWHFQRRLVKSDLTAAVREVRTRSAQLGNQCVPVTAQGLVASLYLLEMFVRTVKLAVGGGGWNARVYPQMLDVAARMDH